LKSKGRERSPSVPAGGGYILQEGEMDRVAMPFYTTDFTDKMDLIYQISGSLNW